MPSFPFLRSLPLRVIGSAAAAAAVARPGFGLSLCFFKRAWSRPARNGLPFWAHLVPRGHASGLGTEDAQRQTGRAWLWDVTNSAQLVESCWHHAKDANPRQRSVARSNNHNSFFVEIPLGGMSPAPQTQLNDIGTSYNSRRELTAWGLRRQRPPKLRRRQRLPRLQALPLRRFVPLPSSQPLEI